MTVICLHSALQVCSCAHVAFPRLQVFSGVCRKLVMYCPTVLFATWLFKAFDSVAVRSNAALLLHNCTTDSLPIYSHVIGLPISKVL